MPTQIHWLIEKFDHRDILQVPERQNSVDRKLDIIIFSQAHEIENRQSNSDNQVLQQPSPCYCHESTGRLFPQSEGKQAYCRPTLRITQIHIPNLPYTNPTRIAIHVPEHSYLFRTVIVLSVLMQSEHPFLAL